MSLELLPNDVKQLNNSTLNDTFESLNVNSIDSNMVNVTKMDIVTNDEKPCIISTDPYLYRKSIKERVFQPCHTSKDLKNYKETESLDFLKFDDCDDQNFRPTDHVNKFYQSLRVKRLKGNENRTKYNKKRKINENDS